MIKYIVIIIAALSLFSCSERKEKRVKVHKFHDGQYAYYNNSDSSWYFFMMNNQVYTGNSLAAKPNFSTGSWAKASPEQEKSIENEIEEVTNESPGEEAEGITEEVEMDVDIADIGDSAGDVSDFGDSGSFSGGSDSGGGDSGGGDGGGGGGE